jgi:hypothetical protein
VYGSENILEEDLTKIAKNIEGMFINWEWESNNNAIAGVDGLELQWQEFQQKLDIPKSLLDNGIVWVWTPKTKISEMIYLFMKKDFQYIENVVVCKMKNPSGEMLKNINSQSAPAKTQENPDAAGDLNENSDKENIETANASLGKRAQPCITSFFGLAPPPTLKKKPFEANSIAPQLNLADQTSLCPSDTKGKTPNTVNTPKENLVMANGNISFMGLKNTKVDEVFLSGGSQYAKNTKLTLLMFRRVKLNQDQS